MDYSLEDIMVRELKGLHEAERENVRVLQTMSENAASDELREALEAHLRETQNQVKRIEQIFDSLGETPAGEPTKVVEGLVEEAEAAASIDADDDIVDIDLINAAEKMVHFEIACYSGAVAMADAIGMEEASKLLSETLAEERRQEHKLRSIAQPIIKRRAEVDEFEMEAEDEEEEA
jgi:ferritin-like metal-binding protein YciE